MPARAACLLVAVTAALLGGIVSPSAAESEQAAAARAVAGRMLVAPRAETLVKRLPARVVVRVPTGTTRLLVRVGRRDVTARFRRARGRLRVAHLTRRDGLRYGPNHLSVLAERGARRPVADARSFILVRRDARLVRLRVRAGPVTSLKLRVTGAPSLAPEHFGEPGEVERRLAAIRRQRTLRVWLNGRRVTRALDRSQPTRWKGKLSASHGLRYGVNRLRILVAEPDRGRYQVLRRRFVVRRDHHMAAAGWDIATRVGARARLDGRRSRTLHGARPDHSWRILSRPRGSRAKLRRAGSARPFLTPDRRGHYVIGLTVKARPKRATAAQATPSSADRVTLTAGPAPLLLPFKGLTVKDGRPGIQVGNRFYANPPASGGSMQWLTLKRDTLEPTGQGNSWFDDTPEDPGFADPHNLVTLTSTLAQGRSDELVVLSFGLSGNTNPIVRPDQVDAFNGALKTIGVRPIDASVLTSGRQPLVIVGVPKGEVGSGWSTTRGEGALTGWLMPDGTAEPSEPPNFRFQPERPPFNTSSSSTHLTNTMSIRDEQPTGSLPDGVTGGFHVVEIDPVDFTVVKSDAYGSGGSWDGLGPMVARLNEIREHGTGYVAVQSIGHATPSSPTWPQVAAALAAFGANPHTFNTVDGSYAFIGGTKLARTDVADSSTTVAIDENKGTHESGKLEGRVSLTDDGHFEPVAAYPTDGFQGKLYDMVFRPSTPWPYTKGGSCSPPDPSPCSDLEAAAYANAMADITSNLPLMKKTWAPDVRQAYVANIGIDWSDNGKDLIRMRYPGDGNTCIQGPGRLKLDPGYTREQFCKLNDQLQDEFDYLDATKTLFDNYEKALGRTASGQAVGLQTIGDRIRTAVAPPDNPEIAWSVGSWAGDVVSAGLLAFNPEGTAILAAWEFLVTVYDLTRELIGETAGAPLDEQVTVKMEDLSREAANRILDTQSTLDRLRQVINSDYGRLKALGESALGPAWSANVDATTKALTRATNASFSSALMPIPYGVYALRSTDPDWGGGTEGCYDLKYGHTWNGTPGTAQMVWQGGFERDGQSGPSARFVLGRHALSIRYYAYPPKELTDPMFGPPSLSYNGESGYGMQLPRFIWEQYEDVPKAPPTDIAFCSR